MTDTSKLRPKFNETAVNIYSLLIKDYLPLLCSDYICMGALV